MTDTKPPIASRKAGYWLALAAFLLAAALVRLHDYDAWDANPGVFTFDHEPMLLNMDGYRYLRMARDLHEGTYEGADPLRTAPKPMSRPNPPPLLAVRAARRTIADGQFMEGERQVYANAPLAHPDEAVARRLMRFYAARGMKGMRAAEALAGSDGTGLAWLSERLGEPPEAAARALLEAVRRGGPEGVTENAPCASVDACRAFLFPERVPPVYVLLTRGILTTRWFRYGSWDRAKGASAPWALHVAQGAARSGDRLMLGDGAVFDVGEGGALDLTMQGKTVSEAVGTLATHEGEVIREIDYGHPEGLRIDWKPEEGVATIVTANVGRSVFHRLFVRREGDGDAFRPVAVDDPAVALWEVVARAAPR